MQNQEIRIAHLDLQSSDHPNHSSKTILLNEIKGIQVEDVTIQGDKTIIDTATEGYKTIYLFVKGFGRLIVEDESFELVPESILLPNDIESITIKAAKNEVIHYLKISCKLTDQDLLDIKELPEENTHNLYYKKFEDCQAYVEPIKSPNTISRTILSNKYIPRIAMGTVKTTGPDEVGAHKHPMLEQLFLGLSKNQCVVYADDAKVKFPQYSLLHIPLGSTHWVTVDKDETMYYVWMDFFLDKKGEEWLKTHIVNDES